MMASRNTRERLVDTAIDLIWVSSYGSVSVDDICKAADVRKGSFYHYFSSKVDLAIAAMDTAYERYKPLLNEVFSPTYSPAERFRKYSALNYDIQKEIAQKHGLVCGCPMVSLASEMAPQEQSIHQKTEAIIASKIKYYESALADMVAEGALLATADIVVKAQNIYAFMLGRFVMARIQNSLTPLEPAIVEEGLFSIIGLQERLLKSA